MESEPEYVPTLLQGPYATLGHLIHEALSQDEEKSKEAIKSLLRRILDREIMVPSSASDTGEVTLLDAIGISSVLRRMPRLQSVGSSQPCEAEAAERTFTRLREHSLVSDSLGVRGRIDLLEKAGDWARVTDFKTGSIWSEPHVPKECYRTQLEAYAMLVEDYGIASRIDIRLIGVDGEWKTTFDRQARIRTRKRIEDIEQRVPRGSEYSARALGQVGPACRYCNYRPNCPVYVEEAPSLWNQDALDYSLPNDTWGTIKEIQVDEDGRMRVYLNDAAGRYVCIFGVPARFLEGIEEGHKAGFFSLRSLSRENSSRNFAIVTSRLHEAAHAALILPGWPIDGDPS